jgi:hypothetical protein
MPTHDEMLDGMLDEMAARQYAAERDAARVTRRDLLLTALACFGWCVVALALIGWSAHTTDEGYGRMAFALGLGAGNAGIIFTCLAAYRRGEQRGDW